MRIKRVCVYCGASSRVDPLYFETAQRTGEIIAKSGLEMVYGGGRMGLMGVVADSALSHGAHVMGFIPKFLDEKEGAHSGLSYLEIVDTMHTRKMKMTELADAFIILPGGFGTLDELFEILTWRQINIHNKPIYVVNTKGYWDPLRLLIQKTIEERFATPLHATFATFVTNPDEAIEKMLAVEEKPQAFATENI